MALAYLVAGVVMLIGTVLWNVDADQGKQQKGLTTLIVIVALACIIMSFATVAGVKI